MSADLATLSVQLKAPTLASEAVRPSSYRGWAAIPLVVAAGNEAEDIRS